MCLKKAKNSGNMRVFVEKSKRGENFDKTFRAQRVTDDFNWNI